MGLKNLNDFYFIKERKGLRQALFTWNFLFQLMFHFYTT